MKIIVAKTAGFCMGVRRVVDLAVDTAAATHRPIHTLGPLIHNKQTMEMLKGRGIQELSAETVPDKGETVMIRAHGVPPASQTKYEAAGCDLIDGTCPKVKTVHKVITKYKDRGYAIIITGDTGHAEVVGLQGYAGDAGHLVQQPEDISGLPHYDKVCLVSQTTYDKELFNRVADAVKTRYAGKTVVVKKTICSATEQRQHEVQKLSREVDIMVVVGGKHSANTLRLAEIAGTNTSVLHVETEKEIDWNDLKDHKTVGVTAGASTPNWMIQRVVDHLQYLDQTGRKTMTGFGWRILDTLANLNFFAAVGAVAMYYAATYLQDYPFSWTGALTGSLYLFSMYLWNGLTSIETTRHLGLSRNHFYSTHRTGLQLLALAGIAGFLVLAWSQSRLLFWLMFLSTFAGTVYHISIVPGLVRRIIPYGKLKDIPTSKDLFIALAWGTVITFIPHATSGTIRIVPASVLFFVWMFFLAYVRSVMVDLKDIEGDRIMGRETLVTILGDKKTRRVLTALLIVTFIGILTASAVVFLPLRLVRDTRIVQYLFQTPALLYAWLFMKWGHRITAKRPGLFSLIGDGQYLVAGMGALVASLVV